MPFLTNPFKAVYSLFSPARHERTNKRSASDAFGDGSTDTKSSSYGKRGKTSRQSEDTKDSHAESNTPLQIYDDGTAVGVQPTDPSIHQLLTRSLPDHTTPAAERRLMPPPSTPANHGKSQRRKSQNRVETLAENNENASQATRSTRIPRSEVADEYNMEEARRRAAATQLPPNSGPWHTDERELFFHLSYRGFEPLLPNNWMLDFPTLPLSVFAHQDEDEPLVSCHRSTEFRGCKALQELLETGTMVRDRNVANKTLRCEPILERATKKYFTWAFRDCRLSAKTAINATPIPVHVIAAMQPGQKTQDVLRSLARDMHTLAERHRTAVDVQPSIEPPDLLTPTGSSLSDPQSHIGPGLETLPVIYGLMICSSVLAIFTLNCHTPAPSYLIRALKTKLIESVASGSAAGRATPSEKQTDQEVDHSDEDTGLKFIASFDFSDGTADVWNALVIAITAMQVRKTLAQAIEARANAMNHEIERRSIRDNEELQEDIGEESWLSNIGGDVSHVQNLLSGDKGTGVISTSDDPDA